MTSMLIQQAIILALSFVLLVTVLRRGRAGELAFSLSVLWSGIAAVGLLSVLVLPRIDVLGGSLGVTPAALLAGSASTILAGIALALSVRLSRMEARFRDLVLEFVLSSASGAPGPTAGHPALAVVPALNEEASVGAVVRGLIDSGFDVLVVDDGSTDRTASVARSHGADVISLPLNLGVGAALRAGFTAATRRGYQQVVQCDADGQHPPAEVMATVRALEGSDADIVIGSRFLGGDADFAQGVVRRWTTRVLAVVASIAAGQRITDSTSGLRAIRSPLLDELARAMPPHFLGDTFEVNVMAGRAGYRIAEIEVRMLPRTSGTPTASPLEAVRLTIRALLVVGLRISSPRLRDRAAS